MKKLLLFCLLSMTTVMAKAAFQFVFNMELKNGTVVSIPFEKQPVVTYKSLTMTVKANDTSSYTQNLSDVKRIFYSWSDVPTAINNALSEANLSIENNVIVVSALNDGEVVRIYNAGGQIVKSVRANSNGVAVVNQDELPDGVVIVKFSTNTLKVSK